MYEQPPRGRRVGPALVAVLVVLAGLAGTSAYYVTRQLLVAPADPTATGVVSGPPASTRSTPAATTSPAAPPTTTSAAPPSSTPDPASACPALTAQALQRAGLNATLKLLLYLDAEGPAGNAAAEAWVCQNGDGTLFYQGHRRTGPFTAATSNDTILVGDGIRGKVTKTATEYVAGNPKDPTIPDDPEHTDYHVSATAFFYIDLPQNNKVTYKILRAVHP